MKLQGRLLIVALVVPLIYATNRDAYNALLISQQSSTGSRQVSQTKRVVLAEADYPNIPNWHRTQYVENKANKYDFIISPAGAAILHASGLAVGRYAQALFQELKNRNTAPDTWGASTAEVRDYVYSKLEEEFPDLTLCADRWKAIKLCSGTYASWYQNHGRRGKRVKKEQPDDEQVPKKQRRMRPIVPESPEVLKYIQLHKTALTFDFRPPKRAKSRRHLLSMPTPVAARR